jgi:hypothetical protein
MGLFDLFFDTPENGPCSSCDNRRGDLCVRFYDEKYDRVNGTSRVYDSCSEARSSSGFCGHKGKYWVPKSPPYVPEEKILGYHPDEWMPGEGSL